MRRPFADISPPEEENEINLTPMLDVVFIMLIFFIVTASFVKETGLDVNRPEDQQQTTVQEKGAILIRIDETNEIWIDGRTVDPRAVRANIERLHAENPEGGVVIQTASVSNTDTLITVMDASRQAGVYNVSLASGG
jgi:biopolymer transport protein ExbD